MKKRHDILSGIIEGEEPVLYCYAPALTPRCRHKACRRARRCLRPGPPPSLPHSPYLCCPMIDSDKDYWQWRHRVWRGTAPRCGALRAEPEPMLEAARKEIARRAG